MSGAKRKYPIGREPWTLEGISEKKWRRRDLESRLTPDQLEARRAHIRVTLKAAAEKRLAALTPDQRTARAADRLAKQRAKRRAAVPKGVKRNATPNPVPGVSVYDNWQNKGAELKGRKRPPRGLSTASRVRRSMALRAALEAGSWRASMTCDPEFGQQREDHDATLVTEQVA